MSTEVILKIEEIREGFLSKYKEALEYDFFLEESKYLGALQACNMVLRYDKVTLYNLRVLRLTIRDALYRTYTQGHALTDPKHLGMTSGKEQAFLDMLEVVEESLNEGKTKYYLIIPNAFNDCKQYVKCHIPTMKYFIDDRFNEPYFKAIFTEDEIKELPHQDFIETLIKKEVK